MKKLLNTLYINTPDVYLSVDGENVVVIKDDAEQGRIPLHNLEAISCFSYAGASPYLMHACSKKGIALTFFKPSGRFLARAEGEVRGNVLLRKAQYKNSEEPICLSIAKNIIIAKLHNSRWVLERVIRDHELRVDSELLYGKINIIKEAMVSTKESSDLDKLRGFEGVGTKAYFSVFDQLILQQKEDFFFDVRSRRPPLDNVNALLSFMYSIYTYEIASALEGVGLDPYVGFMHRDRPGRVSLALDILEEFRSVLVDRFVVTMINKREVNSNDFIKEENGAVTMKDDARKKIITAWQKRKQEELTHPFLKEKIQWGLVAHSQALLLARYLRGDLEAYPPFLWK